MRESGTSIQFIHNPSQEVMETALTQDKKCITFFKKSWLNKVIRKMTVSELEAELGYKVEIISE